MANWYCTRAQVKRAGSKWGDSNHPIIDRIIEAASRRIDNETRRFFIPKTETRLYRWPRRDPGNPADVLYLDQGLISVTTLLTQAQDSSPTTISSSDYFLEPNNEGPPYSRIEIDESSIAAFDSGDTRQRSISVAGDWGFNADIRSGGTIASGLAADATASTFVCSDGSLIEVGHTLLIESERIFVSDKDFAALDGILLNGALTKDQSEVVVTVDTGHGIVAGEVIRLNTEQMLVQSVSTNDLTVRRAYNGTVLAAHVDDTAVHINRTLTIERAVNGSTAATHADATSISVYQPPRPIVDLCIGEALTVFEQEQASWGRAIGAGEAARELNSRNWGKRWAETIQKYRRVRVGAI